jgi:uncharacterized protein YcgI (DUF1989 family)
VLRITDLAGQQVGDLVLFRAGDVTERFSQANTRKLENTLYLHEGSRLWSTKCTMLAQIERDTVNRHDILSSACSPYDYPIRFGITEHPSCLNNLRLALEPFGIEEHLIPDPLNVFMRQELSPDGELSVEPPLSGPGDHIDLRLATDCIVAISACPQDQNPCNGWQITDLRVDHL